MIQHDNSMKKKIPMSWINMAFSEQIEQKSHNLLQINLIKLITNHIILISFSL